MKPTWLDKTISWFSPEAGARRLSARVLAGQVEQAVRSYEGASKGRRTKGWKAGSGSANTEIRATLNTLRDRSRYLARNEPYAVGSLDAMVNNTVGAGIIAHAVAKTVGRSKIFDDLWLSWAESLSCDADGRNNFYGLQSLAFRCMKESGEVLIRRRRRKSSLGLAVPLQLQVLEADHIDTYKDNSGLENGGFIVQGVEFDRYGNRVAYWLFNRHPGDYGSISNVGLQSVRVPADEVIHMFETLRPGQVRGIPAFAPIIIKLKDIADYSDATLLRQKLASCFTAFVKKTAPLDSLTASTEAPPALGEQMQPGAVEILGEGEDIVFSTPPTSGDFSQFTREQLRAVARGVGVSYEILTGDYSQVNFSSGRMGLNEFLLNVDRWRWQILIPHFCIPAFQWFTEAAFLAGYGSDPVSSRWAPPKRIMIDPVKETDALQRQVRAGFISLPEAIRQSGYDPLEVMKEIEASNKDLDKYGIVLDSDPRKTNEFGAPYDLNALQDGNSSDQQTKSARQEEPQQEQPIRYYRDGNGNLYKLRNNEVKRVD